MTPRVQDDLPDRIRPPAAAAEASEPFAETRVMFRRA
jgi:hypothetical protein